MRKYIALRLNKPPFSYLVDTKALWITILFALLAVGVMIVSTGMGDMNIHPLEVFKVFMGQGSEMNTLVVQSFRLPRIVVAFMVGAALAVSGAILQGIIRNPLASPDIIGITGGASVAAVGFLAFFSDENNALTVSIGWLPVAAFVGAALIALLVYVLSWKQGVSPIRLVLIGIGLSVALKSLTTFLIILGPIYRASQAYTWVTGSIYGSNWQDVLAGLPWFAVFLVLALVWARNLDVQELGDEIATGVGSPVQKHRFVLLLTSTALAGGAVALAGGIGFVGLMAPHMARKLVGSAFGFLIPLSALIGGIIVLLADLVARTAFSPLDLPAGIFTAAIGAPYFIYLLYKNRNV